MLCQNWASISSCSCGIVTAMVNRLLSESWPTIGLELVHVADGGPT